MGKCNISFRRGLLCGVIVLFVILVAVFFGVILKDDNNDESTTVSPTTVPTISPIVNIKSGTLQGEWLAGAAELGFKFAAFRGIPYAQPPTNKLRFKGPRPVSKWEGVRIATTEGSPCYQAGGTGSEDCLYLNVYTPKLPSNQMQPKLPVYVFIHGGVFQYGSAAMSSFGPHFLVEQDIIVVTMNYRLGVLAHLSLDTDDVPGNADLKDQVQALRWVQDNIEYFGGDPSKVTVGGQSSGGVSASWLTLLPATKGLFRSAITQSGNAVSSWGYTTKNVEFAKKVYSLLSGRESEDLSEIATKFISATAFDLYTAAENATLLMQATPGLGTDISFFHLPCIEKRTAGREERLITKDPESYIIKNETNFIPLMLGETKREWAGFYLDNYDFFKNETELELTIQNLITYAPMSIVPGDDTQLLLNIKDKIPLLDISKYVKELHDFYFDKDDGIGCDNSCRMAKYLDHAYIMADTSHLMQLRSKYSPEPTYGYIFNLKSDLNTNTTSFPEYLRDAVIHGDDLHYIWMSEGMHYDYHGNGTASIAIRRMVSMIANFVKESNPTPIKDDLIPEVWVPMQQDTAETFLEITENLVQVKGSMEGKDNELWSKIFQTIRFNKSP